jgi:hypothetical protein
MQVIKSESKHSFDVFEKEKRTAPDFIEKRKNELAFVEFIIKDAAQYTIAKCSLEETIESGVLNTDFCIYGIPLSSMNSVITELNKACWGYTGFCEIQTIKQEPVLKFRLSEMYECFIPALWHVIDITLHLPFALGDQINSLRYKKILSSKQDEEYQELCNIFESAGNEQANRFLASKHVLYACKKALRDTHNFLNEQKDAGTSDQSKRRKRIFSVGEESEVEKALISPRGMPYYRNTDSRNSFS